MECQHDRGSYYETARGLRYEKGSKDVKCPICFPFVTKCCGCGSHSILSHGDLDVCDNCKNPCEFVQSQVKKLDLAGFLKMEDEECVKASAPDRKALLDELRNCLQGNITLLKRAYTWGGFDYKWETERTKALLKKLEGIESL